ncbi:hypothetical protein Q4E93_19695 [Flavitalea sp. BT771]|uniref:hypothetical protein n=1 Tax=Flavitalea sp. BT771 TaxID=3063329 RepID=UPI0026E1436F|nr:hypothetical protein [Flavitalea sp. BT771]MDO6432841.1 hypothetical protein [Flavitalea sp. BT771]MDV6221883.1 hypothetical protein [Flavitalea sp. BT771]
MSKYITRVQLRNAEQGDYERLDIEMEKGLFVPVREGEASSSGTVETAREYNYRGVTTLQEVITAAYTAAGRIGRQYSLTVMKEKRAVPA